MSFNIGCVAYWIKTLIMTDIYSGAQDFEMVIDDDAPIRSLHAQPSMSLRCCVQGGCGEVLPLQYLGDKCRRCTRFAMAPTIDNLKQREKSNRALYLLPKNGGHSSLSRTIHDVRASPVF